MSETLTTYLALRPEAATFLLMADLQKSLADLFPRSEWLLPQPYKIFYIDEGQAPTLGFPVLESPALTDLEVKLDKWLSDEIVAQIGRDPRDKEKAQLAFNAYVVQTIKTAENAILANLLSDYHGVFWLAHSFDLAKQFSALPRRVGLHDTQAGRSQGDQLKYRIFSKWATEMREQMGKMITRVQPILDGEEERGNHFFRVLMENVLILTEEFIGPDLRELRPFVAGYLHRDFNTFREGFERIRNTCFDLLSRDRVFRNAVGLFVPNPDQGIPLGLLLNSRFQKFLFDHPSFENTLPREERDQLASISRRLSEFAVLHQLRRAIQWMSPSKAGEIVSVDRSGTIYSKSTRPIDFGRAGVVDPMVYRFGLMYDISAFSETLGNLAKAGRKGEINSYRQMLLFQKKLEAITERHRLQFEKFLGDGAFYTTRRAARLIRAAIEIQRFYSEMRKKGFAFNKGIRIALNYGYYRLLPMKGSPESTEKVMEFYGPGVVELSRLTTGKANKEIQEIQGFLIAHGYNTTKVQEFFAPLSQGVDVIDHRMHEREYYAYINANEHLVNEGIVGSFALLQELSNELRDETHRLFRIKSKWGTYVGFSPSVGGVEYIGIRLIGNVQLKGLDKIEVGEIVPFTDDQVEVSMVDSDEQLVTLLRQERASKPVDRAEEQVRSKRPTVEVGLPELSGDWIEED